MAVREALATRMQTALDLTVAQTLNQPGLPRLRWSTDAVATQLSAGDLQGALDMIHLLGQADPDLQDAGYTPDEVPAVLTRWAGHLGLTRDPCAGPGTIEYHGRFESHPIVVWGITDQNRWQTSTPHLAAHV